MIGDQNEIGARTQYIITANYLYSLGTFFNFAKVLNADIPPTEYAILYLHMSVFLQSPFSSIYPNTLQDNSQIELKRSTVIDFKIPSIVAH